MDDLLPGHDHLYDGVPVTMPGSQLAGQVNLAKKLVAGGGEQGLTHGLLGVGFPPHLAGHHQALEKDVRRMVLCRI